MPGCCVSLASEEEEIQGNEAGWAITLHVHHTPHEEGVPTACVHQPWCRLVGKYSYLCL